MSLSSNASFVIGASLGGFLVIEAGPALVFGLDAATFALSLLLLLRIPPLARPTVAGGDEEIRGLKSVIAGARFASRRQELVGSYVVDLVAMVTAFPTALFPFIAADLTAEGSVGVMFAAMSVGALFASVTSGWSRRIRRHGLAIAVAASCWGAAIVAFGTAPNLPLALVSLAVAGGADMLSGVFRDTLWNQTIPDHMRGRLAGLEVVSYGIGPSAGQLRSGVIAAVIGTRSALWSGGLMCVGAVIAITALLRGFRTYVADPSRGTNR